MNDGRSNTKSATKRLSLTVAAGLALAASAPMGARAGGFEEPGIGAEAMGRGGAFAAKADDGTALEYNIAGLARQRGTRVTIEGKLTLSHYQFTRSGSYPTDSGANPPAWSGKPYPTTQANSVGAAPFLAVSTDFDYFERWTFAIGLNTPSASANDRKFPSTVNGTWPAPNRYDVQEVNLLVVYPMLAAAVRVTKWFDAGFALQMVYGHFNLKSTAYGDLGNKVTGGGENSAYDVPLNITTTGFSATGVLGLMFHPTDSLDLAANVRGPMNIDSKGNLTTTGGTAIPPSLLDPGTVADPAKAKFKFHLPWVLRVGARYAFHDTKKREQGDIEIDGTYETWHQAEGSGDQLSSPAVGPFAIAALVEHHYKDTGSVRVGGAYNFWFDNATMLVLRLGFFYDSAATSDQWTRLDFDTLAKLGYTLGLGYHIRGVTINAAYNFISSSERLTAGGKEHIINGLGGSIIGPDGYEPVFNNGKYGAHTQSLFLGLGFNIDEIQKKKRTMTY